MKEFMFYIRNKTDAKQSLTPEQHLAFIKKCEVYIGELQAGKKLIAAQPIIREGVVLRKEGNEWTTQDIFPHEETQVDTIIFGLQILPKRFRSQKLIRNLNLSHLHR